MSKIDNPFGGTLTGDLTITKNDPSIIFNAGSASDTKFWLGVQDDAGNDNDDTFQIGTGTTPGSNGKFTLTKDGELQAKDFITNDAVLGYWDSGLNLKSSGAVRWKNNAVNWDFVTAPTFDVALGRNAAGVLEVNSGSAGTFRDLAARSFGAGAATLGGGSTAGTNTISLANGTEPVGAVAGQISVFSKDSSDGTANATLGLLLEQAVEDIGVYAATKKIKIWLNGVEYWIDLDPV